MDDSTFSYQLSSWLDPIEMINCVERYDDDRPASLMPASLVVGTEYLQSGDEAGFSNLVSKYLNSFSVPNSMIELLQLSQGNNNISEEAGDWLADLSIVGEIGIYCWTSAKWDGFGNREIRLV